MEKKAFAKSTTTCHCPTRVVRHSMMETMLGTAAVRIGVFQFPGGDIQWARFTYDVNDYPSDEEMELGTSINNQQSKMTFGTLRIKSKGLRAPHWHFNANEHGFLLKGSA
ncbi:unnamed protein product [Caretta caretta]